MTASPTVPDIEAFFNLLPNGDRQFIILPGTAHSVTDQPAIVLARGKVVPDHADPDRDVTRDVIKNLKTPCRISLTPFVLRAV